MVAIACTSDGSIRYAHSVSLYTPQDSLALRRHYESEGLVVCLVPARKAIQLFRADDRRAANQTDLFAGDAHA